MRFPQIPVCSLFLVFSAMAWGQGTVNLNNNFTPQGSTTKAFIFDAQGQPMAKGAGYVEVLDSTGHPLESGPLVFPGVFFFGVTEIPGTTPGGSGQITIRAWEGGPGSTWNSATRKDSVLVTLTGLGGGAIPAPSLQVAGNFPGLFLLPVVIEPSTVLRELVPVAERLEVRGEGSPDHRWSLWASGDLVGWSPVGTAQVPEIEIGQPYRLGLRWTVAEPVAPVFYQIRMEP